MDRKSIIGFILLAVILTVWMTWGNDDKEKAAAAKRTQDSLAKVDNDRRAVEAAARKRAEDSVRAIVAADTTLSMDSIIEAKERQKYGVFSSVAKGDNTPVVIQNEKLKATIYPRGGRIGEVELKGLFTHDKKPLILFTQDSTKFGLEFFDKQRRRFNTDSLYFKAEGASFTVTGKDSSGVRFRLYADSATDRYIEYLYTLRGNSYMLGCTISFVGFDKVFPEDQSYVDLNWSLQPRPQEKSIKNERNISTVYYLFNGEEDAEYLAETEDEKKELTGELKWVSFKQQFFSSILIANSKFENGAIAEVRTPSSPLAVEAMSATLPVPIGKTGKEVFPMRFYFGPNEFYELRSHNLNLERQIGLGWGMFGWLNRHVFIPVFSWLGDILPNNYGLVILLLTIIVKIVLFPIAYKSFLSSAKMRALKPEIDELNEKIKDDPMKKQQATMQLYKKAGVNPASGCIPLLLQIPILFSLIRLFPTSFDLRQKGFWWSDDLSTYDSVWDFGFNIPLYGDHVSLFALLMTVSTLLYTWMNQQMLSPGSAQLPGMKWLIYLMPVMFLGFLNETAAALSYYYFVSNIITFGQMFLMQRFVDHDAIRAKIEENKKKPQKTSGFMQRLEQAQRKRLEDMKAQQGKKGDQKGKKK